MKIKTQYSIISRGTEKYSGHGYMGVSQALNNKQYILDIDHGVLESELNDHIIPFKANEYSIYNIALSRFQLIFELIMHRYPIKDNILILGLGNLGFSCLFSLLLNGYKNISIYTRKNDVDLKNIEKKFNIKVKIINEITDEFKTYIDATGSSEVLKNVFENITNMKDVIILSTPRDGLYLIDPLIINRKNITIVGGHELNGVDKNLREELYTKILNRNKDLDNLIEKYVSINNYSEDNKKKLLKKKNNIIDIFKY